MSVQIQREGLAGIYAVRQHPVCQQGDGAAICGLVKDLSQRIIGAVLSGGLHVQLVRCDTHAIGTLHPHRKRRAAASTLIVAGILVMGTRRVADVADAVREAIVRTYEAAVADVDVGLERIRVGILRTLRAMRVRHHDNVLGQLFYTSVDDRARLVFCALVIFRKSKPLAQQPQHIAVSIYRSLYRNAVCTVACDNRAFLQATLQLAPVLDQQAAGKVCLAFEFQRTSVLALLIVIYEDSRHRRSCRLGNRCFIADDQLAALYIQRRSTLIGQAVPIHHERNGFFDRLPLCITAEADRVIIFQRCQHCHRAAIRNAFKGFLQFEIVLFCAIACASLCLHLLFADGANTIFNRFMHTVISAGALAVCDVVGVRHDLHIGQRGALTAVFQRAAIPVVEGIALCQQGYGRNGAACVMIRNCTERTAADGDGSAIVAEMNIAERAACDRQRTVVEPGTRVRCAAGDGDGSALTHRETKHRAAADSHAAAVPVTGKLAFARISNLTALNLQ